MQSTQQNDPQRRLALQAFAAQHGLEPQRLRLGGNRGLIYDGPGDPYGRWIAGWDATTGSFVVPDGRPVPPPIPPDQFDRSIP